MKKFEGAQVQIAPNDLDWTVHEVWFGDVLYRLEFTDQRISPPSEVEGEIYGKTYHATRQIVVLTGDVDAGGRFALDYIKETVMHELIHVAMAVSGYYVTSDAYSEEAIAGVLAGPLLRLLDDERNGPLLVWLLG